MYKIIAICSIISNNMYLSNLVVVIVFIYLYTDIINCFKDFSHFSSFWLNFSSLSSKLFLLRFFSCFRCCWLLLLLFSLRQTCLINRCLLLLFIFIWQTIERNEKREEIYYYITRIFQIFQSWKERRGEKQQDDI